MCCLIFSRRGLAYFGVLVQLLVCLLLVPVITVPVGLTLGVRSTSGRDLSGEQVAFVVGYSCGMCLTAILIFRGIRRESFKLISAAVVSLVLLQSAAAGVTIASWTGNNKVPLRGRGEFKGSFLPRAAFVLLNLISTVVYTSLLVIYGRVLRNHSKKLERRCGVKDNNDDLQEDEEEDSYGGRTSCSSA